MRVVSAVALTIVTIAACTPLPPPDPAEELLTRGRELFFEETFAGNGRTCATCHPATNSFTIDPAFIATLPDDDPLFVAERNPELAENFEKPALMREFGLILENLDGFDDLENRFVMRGVPHTLGLRTSIDSPNGPRTGWSGDGSPGDGTLRSFAVGAVIQHYPKRLDRVPGVDFRLPTEDELEALEAFQLSLGRQAELELPLPLANGSARRGQEIFLDGTLGKCNFCHENAGANANIPPLGVFGNANFNTGVEALPDQPQDGAGVFVPFDDGFGVPGDSTFNTPSIVEAADTGPFFHNNSVRTLEGAVGFYDGESFANSPVGQALAAADPNGVAIELDVTEIEAISAFLRVINALENVRQASELLDLIASNRFRTGRSKRQVLEEAESEVNQAMRVLDAGGLQPEAIEALERVGETIREAADRGTPRRLAARALEDLGVVLALLLETP